MGKIEVPDGMDDERAEKILEQRAKARSGSKKPKQSTRNKAGDSTTGLGEILVILVLIVSLVIAVHFGFF